MNSVKEFSWSLVYKELSEANSYTAKKELEILKNVVEFLSVIKVIKVGILNI